MGRSDAGHRTRRARAAPPSRGITLGLWTSHNVAQRAREIGVRTALGARPSDVVRLVLRHVVLVAAAGIACGLWTAYALSRLLGTVLYGVNPHDLASFAAVGIALAVVAAVASVVPARRAARLDPWQVLR